jgi:hypothetical protein
MAPKIYNGKNESIFNKWCWSKWLSVGRRMKIDPHFSSCTKSKSMWIKDLNIKGGPLNLIEKKVGKILELIGSGGKFPKKNFNVICSKIKS